MQILLFYIILLSNFIIIIYSYLYINNNCDFISIKMKKISLYFD